MKRILGGTLLIKYLYILNLFFIIKSIDKISKGGDKKNRV